MAIRRRIAERIATPLKRAGVETPVLEQIPHRAEELAAFYYEAVQQSSRGQIAELLRIAFAHGKAYGKTPGFWYRVTFPKTILSPNVVAVAEGRRGAIPEVTAPTISIPRVALPTMPSIPKVKIPTIPDITIPDIVIGRVPTSLGRFSCGWAIAGLTDGLNDLMVVLESVMARINEIIDKTSGAVKEVRDNVEDTIQSIKDLRANAQTTFDTYGSNVNASLKDYKGKIQAALDEYRTNIERSVNIGLDNYKETVQTAIDLAMSDFRGKVQTSLNTYRGNIESSVNSGLGRILPALYAAWGIPSNTAVTSINVRNVTSTGFEFQSLGRCTIHWICIGTRA